LLFNQTALILFNDIYDQALQSHSLYYTLGGI
jgi:hypothetical protein